MRITSWEEVRRLTASDPKSGDAQLAEYAYNALDCAMTGEIDGNLDKELEPEHERIYRLHLAEQNPAVQCELRGIKVDYQAIGRALKLLDEEKGKLRRSLDVLAKDTLGHGFKWGKGAAPHWAQIADVLYNGIGLPKQKNHMGKVSTDKEVLAKIVARGNEPLRKFPRIVDATIIAQGVLDLRALAEEEKVLRYGVGPDGRMHFSMNVGATETDRWSTSKDWYGRGRNIHGTSWNFRDIFIPDPGMAMGYSDLEQAESKDIAHHAGEEKYIEAHESGNVHAWVAANVLWPSGVGQWEGKGWPKDIKECKQICKTTPLPWAPLQTYYDAPKRVQHGLNYGLEVYGLMHHAGMPFGPAKIAYDRYHSTFPRIKEYHHWIREELLRTGRLVSALGRERQFFGRVWDPATIREAIADIPQHEVSELLKLAFYRVWNEMDPGRLQVLGEFHDAILFQFPLLGSNIKDLHPDAAATVRRVVELQQIPLQITDIRGTTRTMTIAASPDLGMNWAEASDPARWAGKLRDRDAERK